MATVLQPPLASDVNSFPPSPTLSTVYPEFVSLKEDLPYQEDLKAKDVFVPASYDRTFAPSIPSTAPSSPYYTQSMGSGDSYFSTPAYSSLDPLEDFSCDENDSPFPAFENNVPRYHPQESSQGLHQLDNRSDESINTASPPPERRNKDEDQYVKDDHWVQHEPTRHVDFLSHEWHEQDIWSSWKYVNTRERRKKYHPSQALANGERLENAAWRTWGKAKYDLRTISPESLNWMKDCDVTWLYGPLQVDEKTRLQGQSPPPSQLSRCSSFSTKKPILKKKSASAALLETSLKEHNLLSRVGDIIRIQQSSPVPRRQSLMRGGSEFSLPSYHTTSTLNTPTEFMRQDNPPRYSFGTETPSESKHVLFNETVRQVQAIESEDEKDESVEADFSDEDEDDDGGLMMAPAQMRSSRSTPRGSFSENKTIAPLPSTTLKYRKDTPEPPDTPKQNMFMPGRKLQHSSSQETLKPSNPSHNFLLDDDPEINDDPWPTGHNLNHYSPYAQEDRDDPPGMRRTPSGMFMPYDENEEEAAMNNTLFGQAMYAVNTVRDIAHVVWNVGWNRGR